MIGHLTKKGPGYLISITGLYSSEENQRRGTFHVKTHLLISIAPKLVVN